MLKSVTSCWTKASATNSNSLHFWIQTDPGLLPGGWLPSAVSSSGAVVATSRPSLEFWLRTELCCSAAAGTAGGASFMAACPKDWEWHETDGERGRSLSARAQKRGSRDAAPAPPRSALQRRAAASRLQIFAPAPHRFCTAAEIVSFLGLLSSRLS